MRDILINGIPMLDCDNRTLIRAEDNYKAGRVRIHYNGYGERDVLLRFEIEHLRRAMGDDL